MLRLFVLLCLIIVSQAMFLSGNTSAMTTSQEEELGREFMKVARSNYELVTDPVISDYVNKVGNKIVAVTPSPPFQYQFYVVKEDTYNAFAGPGGYIFINSGLVIAMESEDELAGILGHEISHVACRHLSEMIEKSKKIGIATIAGIAAGIFMGMSGAGTASTALTYGSIAAGQSAMLAYSRENEMQADQIGLKYLEKAGYSAEGLLTILKKIRNRTWFGSDQIPTYLVTHPATEDRIAYIGTWIESHDPPEQKKLSQQENYLFERMWYRLSAHYGDRNLFLRRFETDLKAHPDDALAHYGMGLLQAKEGNYKDAIRHLKTALEKNPFEKTILNDLGKIYFMDGQYHDALNLLESSKDIPYDDPESKLVLGRTQEKLGRWKDAVSTIETLTAQWPDYSIAYFYLGEIYGKHKKLGNAHYYLGIYSHRRKDIKNAVFHLRTAIAELKDPVKKEKAEDLLKEITGKPRKKKKSSG